MEIIKSPPRNYKGLASETKMIGKNRYPTAIEFTDGEVLCDVCCTNEVEGGSPLLLGQDWLEYYKVSLDYASGRAWRLNSQGYHQEIPLAAMKGSHLKMIKLSSFKEADAQRAQRGTKTPLAVQKLRLEEGDPKIEEMTKQFQKLEVSDKTPKVRDQKSHERLAENVRGSTPEFFDLSDEDEEESEDEDVAGRYSQSETEESDTESEGRTRVANTAYDKGRQGYCQLGDSWRLHPMWRGKSKMEIQMLSLIHI